MAKARKKIVAKNVVKRESGTLYFVKGNDVVAVKANRKGRKKGSKNCSH